mgnify:CR=1 FL=1
MLAKEKYYRAFVINQFRSVLQILFFYLFFSATSQANFQEELVNKYKNTDTLYFDFVQKIGEKVEYGNCYIKYPLLMKCEYPKKNKILIANGKKFSIIKKRYKKIYNYPLKKTPLFYILKKENILNLIVNYKPTRINSNTIEYELIENNSNKLIIFFDKKSLNLSGWKTIDSYSNEVSFFIKNIKKNVIIKSEIFIIPKEEDL